MSGKKHVSAEYEAAALISLFTPFSLILQNIFCCIHTMSHLVVFLQGSVGAWVISLMVLIGQLQGMPSNCHKHIFTIHSVK